jgi:hypothetical protein
MNSSFNQAEADAVIAALDALDAAPGLSPADKQRYKADLEALAKLRGFQIDATSGTRRAVAYLTLPQEWPTFFNVACPPWGEQAQRKYLTALLKRYGNWRDIAVHLRGIVDRQFEKANGLLAFNAILIAILTLRGSWTTLTTIALVLQLLSSVFLLFTIYSFWGRPSRYQSDQTDAAESLWIAGKRAVLHNVAVGMSLVALLMIAFNLRWGRPTRDAARHDSAPVFAPVGRIGPFCRGAAAAICTQDAPAGVAQSASTPSDVVHGLTGDSIRQRALQIVIVGTSDRVELTPLLRAQYGSNEGLARARAEHVSQQISSAWTARPRRQPPPQTLILTVGPSIHAPTSLSKRETATDRMVTVYAVIDSLVPKP